ncbi:uncharacterized protein LOC120330921 [Styela clava]
MNEITKWDIFFFIPNLIGYLRLLLIGVSWYYIEYPSFFIPVYMINVILDGIDGWAARKFNQISDFGAVLDVIVDLIGRGMVWCYISKFGYAVIAFEWIVFIGNTERASGKQWKSSFEKVPNFVSLVMNKGFKTPLGAVAIIGLHILPPWLYMLKMNVLSVSIMSNLHFITILLVMARMVCAVVELWCFYKYMQCLLHKSPHNHSNRTQ